MRIYGFTNESVVDGPGIRAVVFAQGCDNACDNCHNLDSWDMQGGEEYTVRNVIKMIKGATGKGQPGLLPLAPSKSKKKKPSKRSGA